MKEKNVEVKSYEAPRIEVIEVQVEKGFAVSEYETTPPTGGIG